MNSQDLLVNGYKTFQDTLKAADNAYQKRVGYTRYFINIYRYDWSKYDTKVINRESFECDLQFTLNDKDERLNLLFTCGHMTVEEMENRVEWLFTSLNCLDYDD